LAICRTLSEMTRIFIEVDWMRELRIHHFFDIIRDYGSYKILKEHAYEHSYHIIGKEIYENRIREIRLVVKSDDICERCSYLSSGNCTDTIDHRSDFRYKADFNDYLDTKIMKCMGYENRQIIEVKKLIMNAEKYLDKIFELYEGNDIDNTKMRKKYVSIGINRKISELGL